MPASSIRVAAAARLLAAATLAQAGLFDDDEARRRIEAFWLVLGQSLSDGWELRTSGGRSFGSPRLVDGFAKRPQVQERLTSQIADALVDVLRPSGALVMIESEHLCMSMRGVRKPGALTVTSAVRGLFKTNAATRAEALELITHPGNRL